MCTSISHSTSIAGVGKGPHGWFPVNQATVAFDHATHSGAEHALLLDFANYELGTGARVALEMDLASGKSPGHTAPGRHRRRRGDRAGRIGRLTRDHRTQEIGHSNRGPGISVGVDRSARLPRREGRNTGHGSGAQPHHRARPPT